MRTRTILAAAAAEPEETKQRFEAHMQNGAALGKRADAWAKSNPGARSFPPALAADVTTFLAEDEALREIAKSAGIVAPENIDAPARASEKFFRRYLGSQAQA